MGSPCELSFHARSEPAAQSALAEVLSDLDRLEAKYSRYRETSLVSAINRSGLSGSDIEMDAETASLFDYADACFQQSGGCFDITSGVLRRVWHKGRTTLPAQSEIDACIACIGWQRIERKGGRLRLPMGMEIDLGGIVKEYAADRCATILQRAGIAHGVVNLGGDIRVLGPQPGGEPWHIGIRDPRRPGQSLGTLQLERGAVATSGDYERCLLIDGRRYGHVLDPRTGWPVEKLASVTVVADLCVVAGSASTIAMLKANDGPAWLAELGLPHCWIGTDGRSGGSFAPRGPSP